MAIEVSESQGNFYTMMGHDMRASVIVVETDRIDECIAEYVANGYTGVAIRPSSFQGEDLSVLLHFPNLLEVSISDMGRLNIDALSTIVGLKHLALHIDGRKEPVDFARFPDLETLSFSYRTGDCGFECLDRLHWISLWKYKRDTSLREPWLRLPSSIRTLELISSSVENLDLLYPSETLERLKVARFRKLEALPDLAHLFPRLNHLWFEASGRLSVDEVNRATKECRDLEFLCLGKNVLISAMSSN